MLQLFISIKSHCQLFSLLNNFSSLTLPPLVGKKGAVNRTGREMGNAKVILEVLEETRVPE